MTMRAQGEPDVRLSERGDVDPMLPDIAGIPGLPATSRVFGDTCGNGTGRRDSGGESVSNEVMIQVL